jgi:hypothetical protein
MEPPQRAILVVNLVMSLAIREKWAKGFVSRAADNGTRA